MKYVLPLCLFISACSSNHTHNTSADTSSHDSTSHHSGHHHHGDANAFMNAKSREALIASWESPERDAYQHPDAVMQYIGPVAGKTVVDIGAGSGYFTFRLARAGAHVIAADADAEFLAHIRARMDSASFAPGTIEPRKVPYDSPSLKPAEADLVLIVNTYHHIENRTGYFREVRAGLNPGGELVVIDFFKRTSAFGPPEEIKVSHHTALQELRAAGFSSLTADTLLLPEQWAVRGR